MGNHLSEPAGTTGSQNLILDKWDTFHLMSSKNSYEYHYFGVRLGDFSLFQPRYEIHSLVADCFVILNQQLLQPPRGVQAVVGAVV